MLRGEPEKFGRYQLIDRIGVGGMAEIFLARAHGIGGFEKELVIKRILPHLSDSEEFVGMFLEEARLSAKLQHPNIVQIHDVGEDSGRFFIAMEYVEGPALSQLLAVVARREQVLPLDCAVFIAKEFVQGLSFAHDMVDGDGAPLTIIHRDVTPSNIMVSCRGSVKLADFGIAKARTSQKFTETGSVKGKLGYLAPELLDGARADVRTDVFAAGVVVYELLTGKRLFKGTSDVHTMQLIRTVDPEPASALREDVPPELDAVVARALARQPEHRYGTATTLAEELNQVFFGLGFSTTARQIGALVESHFAETLAQRRDALRSSSTKVGGAVVPEPDDVTIDLEPNTIVSRRSRWLWVALAIAVLGSAGAAVYFLETKAPVLVVRSQPKGARIVVDGTPTGSVTPAVLERLAPGEHHLSLELDGHHPHDETVVLEHATETVTAELRAIEKEPDAAPKETAVKEPTVSAPVIKRSKKRKRRSRVTRPAPPPIAPAAEPGTVDINTIPFTTVFIDGRKHGPTPVRGLSLPPGRHDLRLVNTDIGIDETHVLEVKSGEHTRFGKRFD